MLTQARIFMLGIGLIAASFIGWRVYSSIWQRGADAVTAKVEKVQVENRAQTRDDEQLAANVGASVARDLHIKIEQDNAALAAILAEIRRAQAAAPDRCEPVSDVVRDASNRAVAIANRAASDARAGPAAVAAGISPPDRNRQP